MRSFAEAVPVDGLSLDTTVPVGWARRELCRRSACRAISIRWRCWPAGPRLLARGRADRRSARRAARFIFNLGHGVLPETDPEEVAALVAHVKSLPLPDAREAKRDADAGTPRGSADLVEAARAACLSGPGFAPAASAAMTDLALWLKALHIMAFAAWMAGLWYLPRLFVYHSQVAPGSEASEKYKVMERRLLRGDRHARRWWRRSLFGIALGIVQGQWAEGWLHAKTALVAAAGGEPRRDGALRQGVRRRSATGQRALRFAGSTRCRRCCSSASSSWWSSSRSESTARPAARAGAEAGNAAAV